MIKYNYSNKIMYTVVALTLMLFTVACDGILELQPESEIGPKNFWKNNTDASSGVAAIYDGMQETYRIKQFLWGEFRADNFMQGSDGIKAEQLELLLQNLTEGNEPVLNWNLFYKTIARANDAIKNIPKIVSYDKNLLAEAYALRAYLYFDAIRVWGAVPMFTEPSVQVSDLYKKRTDSQIIMNDLILPDMLKAEELMSTLNSDFHFSKVSILCLQANVYMWLKEYALAKEALDKMIGIGGHGLVKDEKAWEDLFYNNVASPKVEDGRGKIQKGAELILSIRYSLEEVRDNPGSSFGNRSGIMETFFAGIPAYYISPLLEMKWQQKFPTDSAGWVDKYPGVDPVLEKEVSYIDENGEVQIKLVPVYGDWRYYFCREGGYISPKALGEARLSKWQKADYSRNNDDTDIVLYRYADMILLLAEAENQLGNNIRALELVNQVRIARKLPLVSEVDFGVTKDARENYILDERQLELIGEGKRWWDLRRTDKAIEVLNPILEEITGSSQLTEERLFFPIYVNHLIENSLLDQNKGY